MYTELYMRRKIKYHEAEIIYLQESQGLWSKKFANEPRKRMAAVRALQRHINQHQAALVYWQAVYSDKVQS